MSWSARRTVTKIAQLRCEAGSRTWALYCADGDDRWWPYDFAEPSAHIDALLGALGEDASGIFRACVPAKVGAATAS
jgi:hypothetical protein